MQELMPSCDVARMVELQPRLFLHPPVHQLRMQLASANQQLRAGLPESCVDAMLQEDPSLLFEDVTILSSGLKSLHELWDVDAAALQKSDPMDLALAVRALSVDGPPEKV